MQTRTWETLATIALLFFLGIIPLSLVQAIVSLQSLDPRCPNGWTSRSKMSQCYKKGTRLCVYQNKKLTAHSFVEISEDTFMIKQPLEFSFWVSYSSTSRMHKYRPWNSQLKRLTNHYTPLESRLLRSTPWWVLALSTRFGYNVNGFDPAGIVCT